MFPSRIFFGLVITSVMLLTLAYSAHAQAPIVVNAVDNDPDNRLWNCETNRVPFDNQETDRSRCFTFRYTVPPEGITSATVHIALDTLGSLQDTDATIVAVGKPVENCAWAIGNMAGCVVLHGGFKGGEKSLNLNLLNITCDTTIPNTAEAQQLVREQLESGVLHMLLQDDTAVYSAQLVLNGGAPSFTCGTSEETVAQVVATQASSAPTASAPKSALDQIFNPPQFLIHATGHGTINGPVQDDWWLLYPRAPDAQGFFELADGTGGTFTYSSDYSSGPYTTPRQVCEAAGARVGTTSLAAWNGGESFRCNDVAAPPITNSTTTSTASDSPFFSKQVTQILTGTTEPTPPNLPGAAMASVAGALALALFAAMNYLVANPNYAQSAMEKATRQFSARDSTRQVSPSREADAKFSRVQESARDAQPTISSERAGANVDAARSETSASSQTMRGETVADATANITRTEPMSEASTSAMRAEPASDAAATMMPSGAENAPPARTIDASGAAGMGKEFSGGEEIGAVALDKAAKEGMSSIPDASELVKDKLIEKAEQREKRERLRAQKIRLEETRAAQEQTLDSTRAELKRVIDVGGDFENAQRAWRQAEHALNQTRAEWERVTKQLAALDEKKKEDG